MSNNYYNIGSKIHIISIYKNGLNKNIQKIRIKILNKKFMIQDYFWMIKINKN